MTNEELEKLKKDHDYCIIPIKNIVDINDITPILNYDNFVILSVKADKRDKTCLQFVNSDYFRTLGAKFEENNIKPDLLYRPSNITVEELRDGAMKEIEAIIENFYAKLEKAEKDMGIKK